MNPDSQITQELYYSVPQKYIHIYGKEQQAANLHALLAKHFRKNHQNYHLHLSDNLSLPKVKNKPSFIDRAYNVDKSLTNNMRFGILHTKWLYKYLRQKPTIILFVFDIEDTEFNNYINDFITVFKRNENSIRKNKIKCLYVLSNRKNKTEDEKNALKNIFDISNKHIVQTKSEGFEDCFKEIESFIRNNNGGFYQSKIVKYKDNLLIGNPENLRFKEYYARNLIKIAFFNLFLCEHKKALKYFEKSLRMCYELVKFYHVYCSNNVPEGRERLLKYFYYIQKVEEVKRIANLLKIWTVFLKYREKDLTHSELFKESYGHLKELRQFDTWSLTPFKHFKGLYLIDFIRVFLFFARTRIKSQEIFVKMNLLILVKNLLETCLGIFGTFEFPAEEKINYHPFSIGLLLRSETHNLEKTELNAINETLLIDCPAYEQRKSFFLQLNSFLSEIIQSYYHKNISRTFNVVMLLKADFERVLKEEKEVVGAVELDESFKNFPCVYRKALQAVQTSQKDIGFVLKELIEFREEDLSILDIYLKEEEKKKVYIEVNADGFNLEQVFETNEIDNYGRINLNFSLQTNNTSFAKYIDKVKLKFNEVYYNEEIEDLEIDNGRISFKKRIHNHNPNLGQSAVFLQKITLIASNTVFIDITGLVEKNKACCKLKINKKPFLTLETDLTYDVHLNNEYFPVTLRLKQNLSNWEDYNLIDPRLTITPFDPKKYLKSIKLYQKKGEEKQFSINETHTTPGIVTFDPVDSGPTRLFRQDTQKTTLNPELEVLNSGEGIFRDRFPLPPFDSELITADFQLKIKLTNDFQLEIEWSVSLDVADSSGIIIQRETISQKTKIKVKCGFLISKNQQLLNDNYIIEQGNQKINDRLVQTDARYYLNFYIKSSFNSIEVLEFIFNPGESTKVDQTVNPFTSSVLAHGEGTNIGILFSVTGLLSDYNIGDLFIKWRRKDSKYVTRTQFKNLLVVSSFTVPFKFEVSCPLKALYCRRFNYQYSVKNVFNEKLRFYIAFQSSGGLMVAGMTKMHMELAPEEVKKVVVFVVCTDVGVCKLPDFDVYISETKQRFSVKNLRRIEVVYDALEE